MRYKVTGMASRRGRDVMVNYSQVVDCSNKKAAVNKFKYLTAKENDIWGSIFVDITVVEIQQVTSTQRHYDAGYDFEEIED